MSHRIRSQQDYLNRIQRKSAKQDMSDYWNMDQPDTYSMASLQEDQSDMIPSSEASFDPVDNIKTVTYYRSPLSPIHPSMDGLMHPTRSPISPRYRQCHTLGYAHFSFLVLMLWIFNIKLLYYFSMLNAPTVIMSIFCALVLHCMYTECIMDTDAKDRSSDTTNRNNASKPWHPVSTRHISARRSKDHRNYINTIQRQSAKNDLKKYWN